MTSEHFSYRGLPTRVVLESELATGVTLRTDITSSVTAISGPAGPVSSMGYSELRIPFHGSHTVEMRINRGLDEAEMLLGYSGHA